MQVAIFPADLPSDSIGETQRAVLDERLEGSLDLARRRSILRVETQVPERVRLSGTDRLGPVLAAVLSQATVVGMGVIAVLHD